MISTKKVKILFLTPRFPYPLVGGDRIKSYHLIAHLASKYDVTLVSFYQGKTKYPLKEHIAEVEKLGLDLHIVPISPMKAGLRILFTSLFKYPLEIGYYTQPEFARIVDSLLASKDFDFGISFFMRTAEYIKDTPIKKILVSEDCRRLYQQRSYEKSTGIGQKAIRRWEYKMLKKYEPEIVNHFNVTTLVSNEDIKAMQSNNSNVHYALLSNGVDLDSFTPKDSDKEKIDMLFTGKLDLWANYLMINTIVKEILPGVRKKMPDIKFNIVGANPTNSILALQNEFINVYSNVPSMVPYLQKASIFIHPHQGGSGIQNKLLEAMACGIPVVTSPTGVQGIEATHGIDVMIGRDSEEMIRYTIKILTDKAFAEYIGNNARQLMIDTHSWKHIFDEIDSIMNKLLPELNEK